MSLSCSCTDDPSWYYEWDDDYSLLNTKRARRCCSYGSLIKVGSLCLRFEHYRPVESDIEATIHGDDGFVFYSDKYMCEPCADQFFNLHELGFCIDIFDNMQDLLKEYREMVEYEADERVRKAA